MLFFIWSSQTPWNLSIPCSTPEPTTDQTQVSQTSNKQIKTQIYKQQHSQTYSQTWSQSQILTFGQRTPQKKKKHQKDGR